VSRVTIPEIRKSHYCCLRELLTCLELVMVVELVGRTRLVTKV